MAMDFTDFKNCPVAKYCEWKILASPYKNQRQDSKQVEVCKHCKRRAEYTFDDQGRMTDQYAYYRAHIRDFCQPTQAVYFDIHPNAPLRFETEARDEKRSEEFQAEKKEQFEFAIKRALEDKDDGITKKG
jgi:hypothetical protein